LTISESQLDTWSHQGSTAGASAAYESIRAALISTASPVRDKDVDTHLQGSYKNDTNIRADSDVDVVVELKSTFQYDIHALPQGEETLHRQSLTSPTYSWPDFRNDVLRALKDYFGATSISEGNKSVKVTGDRNRVAADVIVSLQHRKYRRFRSMEDREFIEGIAFKTLRNDRWIVNFPKLHYENCVEKNSEQRTNGWYKPTVRVFKNARKYLVDRNIIPSSLAPSYFLESLIYNPPDNLFGSSHQITFRNVLNWLTQSDYSQFLCPNRQTSLFGETEEQWSTENAQTLVSSLVNLWNNWR